MRLTRGWLAPALSVYLVHPGLAQLTANPPDRYEYSIRTGLKSFRFGRAYCLPQVRRPMLFASRVRASAKRVAFSYNSLKRFVAPARSASKVSKASGSNVLEIARIFR